MRGAFLGGIHKIAATGWAYDAIQFLAGASIIRPRLREYLAGCRGRVLDVGGGTGLIGALLPPGCSYICLDNEIPKLQAFVKKSLGSALLADATRMPILSNTIDVVTCIAVTHHLPSEHFEVVLREITRVLKVDGSLILLDAVLKPSRLPGRILWALDRGAYPRSSNHLREAVERHFRVEQWNRFAVYHEYVVGLCRRNAAGVYQC